MGLPTLTRAGASGRVGRVRACQGSGRMAPGMALHCLIYGTPSQGTRTIRVRNPASVIAAFALRSPVSTRACRPADPCGAYGASARESRREVPYSRVRGG